MPVLATSETKKPRSYILFFKVQNSKVGARNDLRWLIECKKAGAINESGEMVRSQWVDWCAIFTKLRDMHIIDQALV